MSGLMNPHSIRAQGPSEKGHFEIGASKPEETSKSTLGERNSSRLYVIHTGLYLGLPEVKAKTASGALERWCGRLGLQGRLLLMWSVPKPFRHHCCRLRLNGSDKEHTVSIVRRSVLEGSL